MGQFFFLAVAIFVIVTIVRSAGKHRQRIDRTWATVAERLGLEFQPAKLGSRRQMLGVHKGLAVRIDEVRRGGKNKTTYTRYRVGYPRPLGIGLRLTPQGFINELATKLFSVQDIQIGDRQFDGAFVIKGTRPDRAIALLYPELRGRILQLASSNPGCTFDDEQISWEKRGSSRDPNEMLEVVRRMGIVASRMAHRDGAASAAQSYDEAEIAQPVRGKRDRSRPPKVQPVTMPIEEPTRPPKRPLAESGGAAAVAAALTVLRDKKAEPQRPEPVEVEAAIEPPPVVELPPVVDSPSAFERFAQAQSDLAAESAGEADVATEREAPPTPPSEAGGPDLAVFCADQFRAEQSSFDASRRFDEVYKGRRIRWEGKLERADKFSFDFVFGGDPGVMAVLEVFELDRGAFGGGKVQAVVRFPPEALESLRARIGERASFGGELLKCDAFMRKIYVADGRLD